MDQRGRRPGAAGSLPPVTRSLLAINLAVQIALTIAGATVAGRVFEQAGLIPARLTGAAHTSAAVVPPMLTLLSSLFVHGGWLHLAMNALFLFVIARFVEPLLGPSRFLLLYLLGGIAGGLAQVLVAPESLDPVIGASGAISAVFGTYVMRFAARPLPTPGARVNASEWAVAARFALAWGALQLLVAVAGIGVAVWAHFGGFMVGLIFGAAPGRRR